MERSTDAVDLSSRGSGLRRHDVQGIDARLDLSCRRPLRRVNLPPVQGGWVYIMASKPHGVLYVGVTANLAERVVQHRCGQGGSRFAKKYNCTRLVHAEAHATVEAAIAREKAMKEWPRLWKLRLIQEHNPEWRDLFDDLNA